MDSKGLKENKPDIPVHGMEQKQIGLSPGLEFQVWSEKNLLRASSPYLHKNHYYSLIVLLPDEEVLDKRQATTFWVRIL